jgi:hypothetical protein
MSRMIETLSVLINSSRGEMYIPIHQATPDADFPDDPRDLVVFGQGIGEIGQSQQRIVGELADLLGRRVIGYEARLGEQVSNPWTEAITTARDTHLKVVGQFTEDSYSIVGHSLFGMGSGAIIAEQQDQITDMTLIAPACVTSEAVVSDAWRVEMQNLSAADRALSARFLETSHPLHTTALMSRFMLANLAVETMRGSRDMKRSMKAGRDLTRDLMPGLSSAISAFGVLANVSVVPDLVRGVERGTNIDIVVGDQDPVFTADQFTRAVNNTPLQGHMHVIDRGRGRGHSNMSTLSGSRQLVVAAKIIIANRQR